MKMLPLGPPFQTLMCFLEQHRPIPHLGQRYDQESCSIALSKKAPDLAQCQPWSDYQSSDDQQQYPTTPAVCHLPGTRETALMYYLMQPVWSLQLLVKNSFQSRTKSWQQSTHNGSCRVTGRIVSQLVPDWFRGQFFLIHLLRLAGIMYLHCEGQGAGRSVPAENTGLPFLCVPVCCQRGAYFSVLFQILLTVPRST